MIRNTFFFVIGSILILSSCNDYTRSEINSYYVDSVPKTEIYYKFFGNNEYVAKEIRYYPTSIVQSEGEYNEKYEKNGKWIYYFETGSKWLIENYKNGVKDGEIIEWYKNGKKMYHGFYSNGLPDGKWILYDENGKKNSIVKYKNGKVVK